MQMFAFFLSKMFTLLHKIPFVLLAASSQIILQKFRAMQIFYLNTIWIPNLITIWIPNNLQRNLRTTSAFLEYLEA